MATRREVNQQKVTLSGALREQCRVGGLMPGQPAPSIRQLAEDYGISTHVANQVLQDLIAEGLFHMVPRVGTFVGRPKVQNSEFYLMLLPDEYGVTAREDMVQIQQGFEERIAEKGSSSIVMPLQRALALREADEIPPLAGLFDMAFHEDSSYRWGMAGDLPRVGFSGRIEDAQHSDEISYDDEGGGRQATRHLIDLGHRSIAYLALHSQNEPTGELIWSQEREEGWRQALEACHLSTKDLTFHPAANPQNNITEQTGAGRDLGKQILARPEITAVVAANDFAAAGLLEVVRSSGLSPERWPSIVGFDNRATINGHLQTSLRLPAEQLGRAAADLLLDRVQGQLIGEPIHRRVAMRLIPRLTSRRDWSLIAGSAILANPQTTLVPSKVA